MQLLISFAVAALALASIGMYGVISYGVTRRTREFGIRLTLGAQPKNIFKMVIREGAQLIVFGLVIGFAASYAFDRLVSRALSSVLVNSGSKAEVLAIVVGVSAATAFAATIAPAFRATTVTPIEAIRLE